MYEDLTFTACIAGVELNALWLQGGAVTVLLAGLSLVTGMIWIIFHLSGSYAKRFEIQFPAFDVAQQVTCLVSLSQEHESGAVHFVCDQRPHLVRSSDPLHPVRRSAARSRRRPSCARFCPTTTRARWGHAEGGEHLDRAGVRLRVPRHRPPGDRVSRVRRRAPSPPGEGHLGTVRTGPADAGLVVAGILFGIVRFTNFIDTVC